MYAAHNENASQRDHTYILSHDYYLFKFKRFIEIYVLNIINMFILHCMSVPYSIFKIKLELYCIRYIKFIIINYY